MPGLAWRSCSTLAFASRGPESKSLVWCGAVVAFWLLLQEDLGPKPWSGVGQW
ncbi:hypothetical protein DPMN_113432 [Dreissena polymorpha]|uniref:Uncharacterized protein n=1 Tax=Dreissena polymorpha TaxID=45954 RepID=A0A9D4KHX9_DREPO|nr:hypothetical protein DPMN_113432 [Dreissena polymorpha]